MTYVALLRGINLGSRNRLGMKDLTRICLESGCLNARTFIQSGNVIFEASPAAARKIPAAITAGIEAAFGLRIPVVLRTAGELKDAIQNNPFPAADVSPETLHLVFLAARPAESDIAKLDPDRSPPDAFAVRGREIYLYTPNGVAKTRLSSAWFDSMLSTIGTARNWRTSLKLYELMTSGTRR